MTDKPLIRALTGTPGPRPPVWLMRQAGRYLPEYRELRAKARDFLDFCYTPAMASAATLQPIRRFGLDGAIIFSDILVIPHALGQDVRFVEGKGPVLEPVRGADGLAKLAAAPAPEILEKVYEALRLTKAELPAATALIGFAGAPWTLATYMVEGGSSREFAKVKTWAYGDPDGFGALIVKLTDAVTAHLIGQVRAGAEALQIFDSWAGALSETGFWKWSIKPIQTIVSRVQSACPGVPIIGFPRGAGVLYEPFVRETGIDAVSIDTSVPPEWAARALQTRVCVQGNLDPIALVAGGAAMKEAAARIIDKLSGGAHVFNLGHGVVPETPPEHVADLVALVRDGAR